MIYHCLIVRLRLFNFFLSFGGFELTLTDKTDFKPDNSKC